MTTSTLEKKIWSETRNILNNQKVRLKDILEWSTGHLCAEGDDEIVIQLKHIAGISVCVKKDLDKRSS